MMRGALSSGQSGAAGRFPPAGAGGFALPRPARAGLRAVAGLGVVPLLVVAPASARQATRPGPVAVAVPPCVIVDIAGLRVGAVDCADARLAAAARAAQARARAAVAALPRAAAGPAVGTPSLAALRQRLGPAFGHGVAAPRPPRASGGRP